MAEWVTPVRTVNAPFYACLKGGETPLSNEFKRGMELFTGKANCIICHPGAMLEGGDLRVTRVPYHPALQQNADRPITARP